MAPCAYLAPLPAQPQRPKSAQGLARGGHVRSVRQLREQPAAEQKATIDKENLGLVGTTGRATSSSAPALRPRSAPTPSRPSSARSPWRQLLPPASQRAKEFAKGREVALQRDTDVPCTRDGTAPAHRRRRAHESRARLDRLCSPTMRLMRLNLQNVKAGLSKKPAVFLPAAEEGMGSGVGSKISSPRPSEGTAGTMSEAPGGPGEFEALEIDTLLDGPPGPGSTRTRKISAGQLKKLGKPPSEVESAGPAESQVDDATSETSKEYQEAAKSKEASAEQEEEESKVPKEKRWEAAFQRLNVHGEIHQDSLIAALELAGFAKPRKQWIDEAFAELTSYSTLDFDEFIKLMQDYEARQVAEFSAIFNRFDSDNSGTLEADELAAVLEHCGITALEQVVREIVIEANPVDPDGITLDEFRRVLDIIYTNEGFSKREVIKLQKVFEKFDTSGDGLLDTKELYKALCWLGYAFNEKEVQKICQSVDVGGSGELQLHEFIVCMRKIKETEIRRVKKVLKKIPGQTIGQIDPKKLDVVLRALGYLPDPQAIRDSAEDAGILEPISAAIAIDTGGVTAESSAPRTTNAQPRRPSVSTEHRRPSLGTGGRRPSAGGFGEGVPGAAALRRKSSALGAAGMRGSDAMLGAVSHEVFMKRVMSNRIGLSELFCFLEVYRRREGMDRNQILELESAFAKYDRDGEGEISIGDVGKILRWMGYSVNFDVQQRLVQEVDVDQSGTLDLVEMRKLTRKFREKELKTWTETFNKSNPDKKGSINMPKCMHLLRVLGIKATDAEVNAIRDKDQPWGSKGKARKRSNSDSSGSGLSDGSKNSKKNEPKASEAIKTKRKRRKTKKKKKAKTGDEDSSDSDSDANSATSDPPRLQGSEDGSSSATDKDDEKGDASSESSDSDGDSSSSYSYETEDSDDDSDLIDLSCFHMICGKLIGKAREAFRGNAGYTTKEVEKMRESFLKYDEDGSGDIDNQEIAKLMADLFPEAAFDPKKRAELHKILAEVDENQDGSLDFPDFLRLMRQFDDMQERQRLMKEEYCKEVTQFSPQEVEGFRSLFIGKEEEDGSYRVNLGLQEFIDMLSTVVRLTRPQQLEVTALFNNVTCSKDGDASRKALMSSSDQLKARRGSNVSPQGSTIDFPEFCVLMHQLLENNFADIQEQSSRIVQKEKQRRERRRSQGRG